jgi:hypothetical protein
MFDPYLSCSTFCLPEHLDGAHVDLARRWTGDESLHALSDGTIVWTRQTKVCIGGDEWYSTPPALDFETREALVPIGYLGTRPGRRVLAFVSPFASTSATFKIAVAKYVAQSRDDSEEVPGLALDLNRFSENDWGRFTDQIRSVEGIDEFGLRVVLSKASGEQFPEGMRYQKPKLDLHAISVAVPDQNGSLHDAKVYRDFHIELDDVSAQLREIAACLTAIFEQFRNHLTIGNPVVGPVHA